MTWQPVFSARFSKPLLEQMVAIIQRDQGDAIAYYNAKLLPIQEFHYGRRARTAPLWLAISADGPVFIPDDDLEYRKGKAILSLDLDVGPVDQEQAQFQAHDYVQVLDAIITSAGPYPSLVDWTTSLPIQQDAVPGGMTTPPLPGTVKDVKVLSHRYTAAKGGDYPDVLLRATVNVQFDLIEG